MSVMKKVILLSLAILISAINAYSSDDKWNIQKSTHFVIYYKDVPSDFVGKVIDKAEDCYNNIANGLGFTRYNFWLWDERAKIYIYNDIEEYKAATGQPNWSSGCVSVRDKTIKTYPVAAGFFDSLLPHELGHIIFREFVGFDNRNIPLWLDEGVAAYQETTKRYAAKAYVRKAVKDNKFMPLDKLSGVNVMLINDQKEVEAFYFEAVAIIDFLISQFGNSSFLSFSKALRDGKTLDEAISYAYPYKDLADLSRTWSIYLKNE